MKSPTQHRWLRPIAWTVGVIALLTPAAATRAATSVAELDPALATSLQPVVPLEQGWREPPRTARVQCWWWWLNGNVTKAAITRDLEEMKAKGFGGANIIDAAHASQGEQSKPPHGPDFASPAWRELFLHALREAERLGLELGFNIQSGWNLGGPTVTPEQSAKEITYSRLVVQGGGLVTRTLPKPLDRRGFYRDVRTLAIPLPRGGGVRSLAKIDNFEQKAYHAYPGGFTAVNADHLLETGDDDRRSAIDPESLVDLTHKMDENGVLTWRAPPGEWLVLRVGYTVDGAKVSTSSDNWHGLAIDYLDPDAFHKYCDDVLNPILDEAKPYCGKSLRYLHTDSWELGPVNWTAKMPAEFEERRGYAMTPFLPALAGYVVADRESSNRFLSDFRRTIAELIADGKYQTFADYAHARGLGIHPESGGPHAAPVDALLCLGKSDIPMGEFWARSKTHRTEDTSRLFVKQPASAAHIYGKRLVMAEAFTTIGPHWEKDPADVKPVFDAVACEGLNLVMWHTFDCSPASMGVPGQAYFAGTHLNPNTTWWSLADGFISYLNRCQFLLQQGLPVADVLYFYGENVPSFVRLKRDNPAAVPRGFDYDVANLEVLTKRAEVENGDIVLPDGVRYRVLVLPPPGHYGLEALRQIARLAVAGANVIGQQPTTAIGLLRDQQEEVEFRELADHLWASGMVQDCDVAENVRRLDLRPDFFAATPPNLSLDYFHRRTDAEDVYFVANSSDQPCLAECDFRVTGRTPEIWDPVAGTVSQPPSYRAFRSHTRVAIDLPPSGSVFVIFRERPTPGAAIAVNRQVTKEEELFGPWVVRFDTLWGGPEEVGFEELIDWSESDDDRIRYFSGTARYLKTLQLAETPQEGEQIWLDLGTVKNLARVRLNGTDLGVTWTTPYRVDLSPALRVGDNHLEVEVVNLWPNRLIGDAALPPGERLTKTNITKFKPDDSLLPSGLLGPVRLITSTARPAAEISEAHRDTRNE